MKLHITKLQEDEKQEKETYPCLREGIGTGIVILFSSYEEGTVIAKGTKDCPIGFHSSNWERGKSKPFLGKLILEMKA